MLETLHSERQTGDDGFSGDEELLHEELAVEGARPEEAMPTCKEDVKFKIPPPQEIKLRSYSLKPDLATGWAHKENSANPIPIIFENQRLDRLIRKIIKRPFPQAKLCYLGPRYENTFFAWYDKRFKFPYDHVKAPNCLRFTNRAFCGQHWEANNGLIFNSFFECANLDCVIQIGEHEYDLFMRVDSNTTGHLQWFNFKVRNLKKLLKYKFNICNFQKDKTLYTRNMKPYIYSLKRQNREKIGWEQGGENVKFERKSVVAAKLYEEFSEDSELRMRSMFRLSFDYHTNYEDDEIQIAYCVPYSYTRLTEFIAEQTVKTKSKHCLRLGKLCHSLGGLEIPLLTIHENITKTIKFSADNDDISIENREDEWDRSNIDKKCIILSGRAHPGESNSSHMMEGFIEFLCGESHYAAYLRRHVIFKIIPMLNPDGVAIGNYRTGLLGKDFNREFRNPDKVVFPEVYNLKKLVTSNKAIYRANLIMFLDFHGHSTKKNTFMYGPEFPITDRYYYESRLFPKILGNLTPMFRYYSCIFKINEFKGSTARAVLLRKLNIPLTYTIETSNGFYYDYEQMRDVPYTEILWRQMGADVVLVLHEYIDLVVEAERNREIKKEIRKRARESKKLPKNSTFKSQSVQTQRSFRVKPQVEDLALHIHSEKVELLIDEIKLAEENRTGHIVSDDEMSEGSSDQEDEKDDLSPLKSKFLLDVVRQKNFHSLSTCKMEEEKHEPNIVPLQIESKEQEPNKLRQDDPVLTEARKSLERFRKKTKIFTRKSISSKEREENFEKEEKKKITAKIINFSFGTEAHKKTSSYEGRRSDHFRHYMPGKITFLEVVNKWTETQKRRGFDEDKAFADLCDLQLRKTCVEPTRNNFSDPPTLHVPKRMGRFEFYKYRRLLANNEHEDTH